MRAVGELCSRFQLLAFCAVLATACEPSPDVQMLSLLLRPVPSCSVEGAATLRVRALGDFSPREVNIGLEAASLLEDFPVGTRELGFSSSTGQGERALGLAPVDEAHAPETAWLLPERRSCPLGDPLALALPGAAVAALPSGGVLVAGGRGADGVVSTAFSIGPGADLAEVVADGMLLRRAYASASLARSVIVIAGGAADDTGSAQDTFEVYEPWLALFARERSRKLQGGPRMQHGSAVLVGGEVLLVGGRADVAGAPLATAELIDADSGEQQVLEGSAGLAIARISPSVLALDDGRVLVVGGTDGAGKVVPSVELLARGATRFSQPAVALPQRAELAAASLPGGRIAWVACDATTMAGAAGHAPCEAGVLLPAAGSQAFERVDLPLDFAAVLPDGLSELRVVALPDGRVLLTGRDPVAAIASRALLLDVGAATLEKREASRVPSQLVSMRDGAVAELDAFGMSLRRESLGSAYDVPGGNLVRGEPSELALDVASHWQVQGAELRAIVDGARMDLPGLRFADLRVQLQARGAVTLVLHDGRGANQEVVLQDGALRAEGCKATLPKDAQLVVTRRGGSLQLAAAGKSAQCTLASLPGALLVALRADSGTVLSKLTLERP